MTPEKLANLRKGIELEDGPAHFDKIELGENEDGPGSAGTDKISANQWYRVTLKEGRNREVRRMFESQELQVSRLIRVRYGPVELGRGVRSGGFRELDREELDALRKAVGFTTATKAKPRRSRPGRVEREEEVVKPRRDARAPIVRNAKPEGWSGYKPRKPGAK
jgi:23S rRNA pseudouridine2605 synthase